VAPSPGHQKWTCPHSTGRPPISAGLTGMQIETICPYKLSIVMIVFSNGGVNRGDDVHNLLG
jgi:hypothetical protein